MTITDQQLDEWQALCNRRANYVENLTRSYNRTLAESRLLDAAPVLIEEVRRLRKQCDTLIERDMTMRHQHCDIREILEIAPDEPTIEAVRNLAQEISRLRSEAGELAAVKSNAECQLKDITILARRAASASVLRDLGWRCTADLLDYCERLRVGAQEDLEREHVRKESEQ